MRKFNGTTGIAKRTVFSLFSVGGIWTEKQFFDTSRTANLLVLPV